MKHWHAKPGLVTSRGTIPLILLLALGAGAPVVGCVSEQVDSSNTGQLGSLGLELEVAPGVTLSSVSYHIEKGDFSKTGSIDVGDSPTISGTIGGIPAGAGYTITLTATSVEDETSFTGSASFDVTAGGTTSVTIHLKGAGASGNGNVAVNATLNLAPLVDELTATPQTVFVGGSVTLKATGKDPDEGPSPLTYYWSTSEGVIDNPLDPNATLTSTSPGTATVKLTISDGVSTASATTTISFAEREPDGSGGGSGAGPERPNILFIIADDLGAESVSFYPDLVGDSGAVPIPNLEALAQSGLVFDNAWASPACSMTRGTIISGQYAHRTGVTYVGAVLPTDTVTVFDRLTAESPTYGHALFGKYHVGGGGYDAAPGISYPLADEILQHVRDIGITTFRGIAAGGVRDYFNWTIYDIDSPAVVTPTFATTAITDHAIDYIHQHEAQKPGEPWFVYQSYNAPHDPFQVPPRELHSVDLSSVGNPAPGTTVPGIPVYKSLIQSLDTELGRLLAEVDLQKTLVIFVGDNGTPNAVKDTGTKVRGSKGSVYEGGVRVPLFVAGAGVTRQGREDDLVVTADLYASILEAAGISVGHVENSYSIKPLLSDEAATSGRTHSFSETQSANGQTQRYTIRDSRYKLLSNNKVRELYDLIDDPLETTDLYASASHRAVRAALEAEIDELALEAPDGYFP